MVLLLLSSMALGWSESVVFQSPGTSGVEYQAHLAAHSALKSPTESLANSHAPASVREHLVAEFAASQRTYLNGDPVDARRRLEDLLSKLSLEHWSSTERQIFFKAALRRAQLAQQAEDEQLWLKFALAAGHDLSLDQSLFPPPLVERYQRLKKNTAFIDPRPPGLGTDWSVIRINGISCSPESCPRFPNLDLPVRVTWLSDKWQPQSVVTPVGRIAQKSVANVAWVSGGCADPKFSPAAEKVPSAQAFFGLDCAAPKTQINFNPVAKANGLTMFDPPKKDRPFYKSPWLWAGVGTVIAIVVANSQRRSEKKEPTTTYGY